MKKKWIYISGLIAIAVLVVAAIFIFTKKEQIQKPETYKVKRGKFEAVLSCKGEINGVATLDGSGQVPLSQLGNVPAAYITSVGNNLDVTSQNLTISDTPTFTSVDVTWVRKEEATWTNAATAGTFTAHTFATSEGSVKYLVRIFNNGASQVSEVLVTTDSSNNIAVLEYGTIYTSENELATITADWDSGNSQYRLRVTTANNSSEILVAATLLAYND